MNEEEKKEYRRNYYKTHKEKLNEKHNKYYESHKDKIKEIVKKYNETHKDKIKEINKKYMESHKEHYKKSAKYQRYVKRNYSRFISLENYIAIMKLENEILKRSIMTRLGMGLIDEDEAVMLSGMVFTEEDNKEMIEWFNVCKCDALA